MSPTIFLHTLCPLSPPPPPPLLSLYNLLSSLIFVLYNLLQTCEQRYGSFFLFFFFLLLSPRHHTRISPILYERSTGSFSPPACLHVTIATYSVTGECVRTTCFQKLLTNMFLYLLVVQHLLKRTENFFSLCLIVLFRLGEDITNRTKEKQG